jgi:uncharacterized membrane protein
LTPQQASVTTILELKVAKDRGLEMAFSRYPLIAGAFAIQMVSAVALAAEPGFYAVTGVAAGDVLNIRAEPDPKSDILESLEPGARPVEVLETRTEGSTEWGRVLSGDANGWVAMRFLQPIEVPVIAGTDIPDGLACGGTEPFWGARLSTADGIVFAPIEGPETAFPISRALNAVGRNSRFAVLGEAGGTRASAIIARFETCTDGMSDRDFGWRIDLLLEKPGDAGYPQLHEGCCRLPVAQ